MSTISVLKTNPITEAKSERCPYCGQSITHEELRQIEERIKSELDAKMKAYEAESRAKIEAEEKRLANEKKAVEADKKSVEELSEQIQAEKDTYQQRIKQEAEQKLQEEMKRLHAVHEQKVRADRAKLEEDQKAVEQQRLTLAEDHKKLSQARKAYQEQLKKESDQKLQAELNRIQEQEATRAKQAQAQLELQMKAVQEKESKAKETLQKLEQEKATFKEELEKKNQETIQMEIEKVQKQYQNKEKELIEEGKKAGRLEGDTERRSLQKKVDELSRQLEKKSADELGSLSEEELAKRLSEAFREDKITRIPKGEHGADVRHEIIHKGVPCGLIIYESKNRKDWQNAYIDRAKEYKTMYQTQSVILVSITFPSGEENFCIRDGIVVVHPSIVVHVAQHIRGTILKLHLQNLSQEEMASKMNEVYKYISGEEFKVQLDSIVQITSDLQKIQQDEKTAHQKVWTKQSALFDGLQKSAFTIQNKIDSIIQATD